MTRNVEKCILGQSTYSVKCTALLKVHKTTAIGRDQLLTPNAYDRVIYLANVQSGYS